MTQQTEKTGAQLVRDASIALDKANALRDAAIKAREDGVRKMLAEGITGVRQIAAAMGKAPGVGHREVVRIRNRVRAEEAAAAQAAEAVK